MKDNTINHSQNGAKRYTKLAIWLHWIIAVGIIFNVILALLFDYIPSENIRFAIDTHKSLGITLLGFAILRLLWRIKNKPPEYPIKQTKLENFLKHATHAMLYILMFMLPLSGWLHDSAWAAAPEVPMHLFGLFEWPRISYIMELEADTKKYLHGLTGAFHHYFSYALYGLVFLHVAAALNHHFSKTHKVRGRGIL